MLSGLLSIDQSDHVFDHFLLLLLMLSTLFKIELHSVSHLVAWLQLETATSSTHFFKQGVNRRR
jgi:hypothetical protein